MATSTRLQHAFWRDLPAGSLAVFLGAVFCTFSTLGFLLDISSLGEQTAGGLAYYVVVSGVVAVLMGYTASQRWRSCRSPSSSRSRSSGSGTPGSRRAPCRPTRRRCANG